MQPLAFCERLADDLEGNVVELTDASHWVVEDRPAADHEVLAAC
jgi:hypothetical protein